MKEIRNINPIIINAIHKLIHKNRIGDRIVFCRVNVKGNPAFRNDSIL